MIVYLWRTLAAHLRQGRAMNLLTLMGVALGVASVLCIQILNRNALGASQGSVEAMSGGADLIISGVLPDLGEHLLPLIQEQPGVAAAWPLISVDVAVAGEEAGDSLFLHVLGLDMMTPRGRADAGVEDPAAAAETPGWVAVSTELALAQDWQMGSVIEVISGDRLVSLQVGAVIDFKRWSPMASRRLALMDIAQAQALLGHRGRIEQIAVRLTAAASRDDVARRLRIAAGPAVRVETPAGRLEASADLLASFRMNLTALSLVSLFVGLFLVYGSTQAALLRRRRELGVLRCLGAGRSQILFWILAEIGTLAVLGVALGLPLGFLAAQANVASVSRTLTGIYLLEGIEQLVLPGWLFVQAGLVGIGGSLAGGLLPAIDLCRTPPRALLSSASLEDRAGATVVRLFLAGTALLAAGLLWFSLGGARLRPSGFILGLALLIGLSLMTPLVVRAACGQARVVSLGLGFSLRSLGARLTTSAVSVAALAVTVSMLVGIGVMTASFRKTVDGWLASTLQADLYISSRSLSRGGAHATLAAEQVEALASHPQVVQVDHLRRMDISAAGGGRVQLLGVDMSLPGGEHRFSWFQGQGSDAVRAARQGAVLVSEPLARRTATWVGDTLSLPGPRGPLGFRVAGVYHDYGSEAGAVFMDLSTLEEYFGAGEISSVALRLRAGADAEAVAGELQRRHGRALLVRSDGQLRREVMKIFDQTFAVTRLLQLMSLVIAAAGITLTLLILARSRLADLAIYRVLGASRLQIFRIFVGMGLGLAVLGMLLGGMGGAGLAVLLIRVVNPAYFGWTIQTHWPADLLLRQAVLLLAVGATAAIYPALRASRIPARELFRDDAV